MIYKAEQSPTYVRAMATVEAAVTEFLSTGIYVCRKEWNSEDKEITGPTQLRSFARAVAKEQKRAFICVEITTHRNGEIGVCILQVPKIIKLRPVVAGLLLVCERATVRSKWMVKGTPQLIERSNLWEFAFPQGTHQVLEEWIAMTRADPVCRIAMGLPGRVT